MMFLVAFDASAFVCYITRFTEENFATLIAFIFIKKAIEKVVHIGDYYPVHESPCFCTAKNDTFGTAPNGSFADLGEYKKNKYACEFNFTAAGGSDVLVKGYQSVGCHYHPNAFLMSILLFIGTFLISWHLKKFKTASFFPNKVRTVISDFAVIIAILTMTFTDYMSKVDTPKLTVPRQVNTCFCNFISHWSLVPVLYHFSTLTPTWSQGRGWLIHPFHDENGENQIINPWWSSLAAIVPAMLATILIFMDQQITAVIVNRKEHKLVVSVGSVFNPPTPHPIRTVL